MTYLHRSVVGIDLSLRSTGVAKLFEWMPFEGLELTTDTITSDGKRNDSLIDRHARLCELTTKILDFAGQPTMAVIEGPVTGVKGASPVDRYSLFWFVVSGLIRREIPVAVISPTALKKAIAGSGRADKVQVALAMAKLWPDAEIGNNDSADAAALAHLGAVHIGWKVKSLASHRRVIAEWPIFGTTAVA